MKKTFTLDDLKNTPAASRNPHLFAQNAQVQNVQQENLDKKNKYGNKKVVIDGIEFDSKKEGNRYLELKGRQMAGEITDLRFQHEFEFEINGERLCSYLADFTYIENGVLIVEDVKSKATRKLPVYRIKNKLMKAIYNIQIKEV